MRLPVSLDDQIAYQEGELERVLHLYPRLAFAGAMAHEALQREIDCQTAILATLKCHRRAIADDGAAIGARMASVASKLDAARDLLLEVAARQAAAA